MARSQPAYATQEDLLLGDMPLSSAINVTKVIDDSADEIDVGIAGRYTVPIDVSQLDESSKVILRLANARLASGRILMMQASASQDDSLHAYAAYLLREAQQIIDSIRMGALDLAGAGAVLVEGSAENAGPTIYNHDSESAVDALYGALMRPDTPTPIGPVWTPGGGA